MGLPNLTLLQFAVLDALGVGKERTGRDLRGRLASKGVNKTGPGFYQLMARLEKADFVAGETRSKEVDGLTVKQRWYKMKGDGVAAFNAARLLFQDGEVELSRAEGGLASA